MQGCWQQQHAPASTYAEQETKPRLLGLAKSYDNNDNKHDSNTDDDDDDDLCKWPDMRNMWAIGATEGA